MSMYGQGPALPPFRGGKGASPPQLCDCSLSPIRPYSGFMANCSFCVELLCNTTYLQENNASGYTQKSFMGTAKGRIYFKANYF